MQIPDVNAPIDARSFLGGYMKKEDVNGPQVVTVLDVYGTTLPGDDRPKLVATFQEFGKPLIINSTNNRRLAEIFGTNNVAQWRGEVTLYVDNNIEYGGRIVGGIRVRAARTNGAARSEQQPRGVSYQRSEFDDEFVV